jgi:sugar lactone lactonase YvrE
MSVGVGCRGRRLVALAALLAAASLCAAVVTTAGAKPPRHHAGQGTFVYRLAGERVFPEGIAVDARGGSFFVSSTGSGAIYRGRLGQRRKVQVYLPGGEDGRSPPTGTTPNVAGVKVDRRGRLYVAGGGSGFVWVYDIRSKRLIRRFKTGEGGFINDLVVTQRGDVWVTDSFRPLLWRIPAAAIRPGRDLELDPEEDALGVAATGYEQGVFNLNGIVAGPRARYLLVVHYAHGQLWRVELPSGRLSRVRLGRGRSVLHGDGLVRRGSILYVVRSENAVDKFRLHDDGRRAQWLSTTGDRSFDFPTTAALARGRLLVVNSQIDDALAGRPGVPPFTVSSIERP